MKMEEIKDKTKSITIEFWGHEIMVDALDEDPVNAEELGGYDYDGVLATWSGIDTYGVHFEIDGEEIPKESFGRNESSISPEQTAKYTDLNTLKEFKALQNCNKGAVWYNKAAGTIDIEIPEGQTFHPEKAVLIVREFKYPFRYSDSVILALYYDGKMYDLNVSNFDNKSIETIWKKKRVSLKEELDSGAKTALTKSYDLPILVFRSTCIGKNIVDLGSQIQSFSSELEKLKEGVTVTRESGTEANSQVSVGNIKEDLEYIAKSQSQEENSKGLDIFVTEGYDVLNMREKLSNNLIENTIAAIWDKSRDNKNYFFSPVEPILVRHIMHDRSGNEQDFTIKDYFLKGSNLFPIPDTYIDRSIKMPITPSIFDYLDIDTEQDSKYQQLLNEDKGNFMF